MANRLNNDLINKISYNNIPQTTLNEIKYRDVNSSEYFNENQKNILNDILDLYNKANSIEKLINENSEILEYEKNHSNFKIKRLEQKIENIENEYDAIINSKEYFKKNIYPCDILGTSNAKVDNVYNCITVNPISYEPKTYVINDLLNETYMPVDINYNIAYENIAIDYDLLDHKTNNVFNAFDGNNNTYWVNTDTVSSDVNNIIASVEFEIPDSIITSRNVNEFLLRPYPANSVDILNIEYKTYTGSYQQIPNYKDFCVNQTDFNVNWNSDNEEYELLDVDSLKFNFNDIQVHKMKITFKQKYYTKNNDNTNTFVWGFKAIEPRYNLYSNDYNKVNFVIEFPKNKIILFDTINPIYSNTNQLSDKKIKFEYYNLYEDGTKVKILNKAPFTCSTSKLYVEAKFKADGCSANILKFEAKYKYSK